MPIYEYSCPECHHVFEEWQKDFQERSFQCPVCGSEAKRMISNTSFILKGSGWYVTDYCRSSSSAAGNGNGSGASQSQDQDKAKDQSKPDDAAQAKPAEDKSKPAKTASNSQDS